MYLDVQAVAYIGIQCNGRNERSSVASVVVHLMHDCLDDGIGV